MARRGRKGRLTKNIEEEKAARLVDDVVEFQDYRENVLKKLRKALERGTPAKEILDMVKGLAAARLGSMAATEQDPDRALRAIEKVLDRTEGKATEKKEVEHKYSKLPDEELDAALLSKIDSLASDPDEDQTH